MEFSEFMEGLSRHEAAGHPERVVLPRDEVDALAEQHGWDAIMSRRPDCMRSFRRDGERINVYFTTGTVGTCVNHPSKGRTQLFRRGISMELLARLFDDPRAHTGAGYYERAEFEQRYRLKGVKRMRDDDEGDDDEDDDEDGALRLRQANAKKRRVDSCPNPGGCDRATCQYGHSCRYGSRCRNNGCKFAHFCRFGRNCLSETCWYIHECKFGFECHHFNRGLCRYEHNCRRGVRCQNDSCQLQHDPSTCRFGNACREMADCPLRH